MNNLKNIMPVAVHIATGGLAHSLDGESDGSFQVTGGTRFRLFFSARTISNVLLIIGYKDPISISNAAYILSDLHSMDDDVPEGTTVYYAILDVDDFTPVQGGQDDTIHISFYG